MVIISENDMMPILTVCLELYVVQWWNSKDFQCYSSFSEKCIYVSGGWIAVCSESINFSFLDEVFLIIHTIT